MTAGELHGFRSVPLATAAAIGMTVLAAPSATIAQQAIVAIYRDCSTCSCG
jgi:hypothetical protein